MSIIRKSLAGLFVTALAAGSLVGCGGASSIDQAGAGKAAAALMTADSSVSQAIQAKIQGGDGKGLSVTVTGTSYSVSGTMTGAGGGSVSVTGTGSININGTTTMTMTSLTLAFDKWVDSTQNLTLNGTLSETASATVGASGVNSSATYKGSLDLSGSITGTAVYDLTLATSGACVTEKGTIGGFSIDLKVGACS